MRMINRRSLLAGTASLLASPAFASQHGTVVTTGENFGKNGLPPITVLMAGHDY